MFLKLRILLGKLFKNEKTEAHYVIAGKKYRQEKLFMKQLEQLFEVLAGDIKLDEINSINDIAESLKASGKIYQAVAVLLIPAGQTLQERDLLAETKHIEWNTDIETAMRIIDDFFEITLSYSNSDLLRKLTGKAVTTWTLVSAKLHQS